MDTNAQQIVDRTGIFRVRPLSWALRKSQSSDWLGIIIQYAIVQQWVEPGPGEEGDGFWGQEWPPGWYVSGPTGIVKVNGDVNEGGVKALKESGVWTGDLDQLESPPPDVVVIVTVKDNENKRNGQIEKQADWLQPNADVPRTGGGGLKPADPSLTAAMKSRFGSAFRAIGGVAPAGQVATPPATASTPTPATQPAAPAPAAPATPAPGAAPAAGRAPAPPSQPAPFQPEGIADEDVPF